jgi:hypothetical protein
MSRTYSAALMTLLALTVTSLAGAQQASSDTAHHAKASTTRDQRQDRRTITADSIKLNHDIAVRDSARAMLEADHERTHATSLRLDSLRTALAAAKKASPRDTAAIRRDTQALNQAKKTLDQDLDRAKREAARLATLQKTVDQESHATIGARRDLGADRKAQQSNSVRRDERQDQHTIAVDSTRLHQELAVRDSVRSALEADHDSTHATSRRLDSLRTALAAARKATPRDSAAIKRDLAALNQAKQALDRDLDRGKQEAAQLAAMNRKVEQESDATIDARRDLHSDRSAAAHAPPKSHKR